MTLRTKVGGTWRGSNIFVKVAGTWRPATVAFVKVGGIWHKWLG
jgi:hypothetical protein